MITLDTGQNKDKHGTVSWFLSNNEKLKNKMAQLETLNYNFLLGLW